MKNQNAKAGAEHYKNFIPRKGSRYDQWKTNIFIRELKQNLQKAFEHVWSHYVYFQTLDPKWKKVVTISKGDKWFIFILLFILYILSYKKKITFGKRQAIVALIISNKKTNENFRRKMDSILAEWMKNMDCLIWNNLPLYVNIYLNYTISSKTYIFHSPVFKYSTSFILTLKISTILTKHTNLMQLKQ